MRHFQIKGAESSMSHSYYKTLMLFFGAVVALSQSSAYTQTLHLSPNIRIAAFLPTNESDIDRIALPVGGIHALERAIHYPDILRRAGLEGKVVTRFTVDTLGNISNEMLYYSDAAPLNENVSEALRTYQFRPALRRGHRVPCDLMIAVMFSSRDTLPPCSIDSSQITQITLEHQNEYNRQADRTIVLFSDGSAMYSGFLATAPIDTSSEPHATIRIPDNYYFGINGGFNPLDFERLSVLLQRVISKKRSDFRQRIMRYAPCDTLAVVMLDGRRIVLADPGDDLDFWCVAKAIDCIAARMQWYDAPWPRRKE
jgi:TonB family protein